MGKREDVVELSKTDAEQDKKPKKKPEADVLDAVPKKKPDAGVVDAVPKQKPEADVSERSTKEADKFDNKHWSARKTDKIARKKEKRKQFQKDDEAKAELQVKVDQKVVREKANEKLKKKGKMTKKEKYLAAKAAKKAQAQGQKKQSSFNVEAGLAAAKLEKLDPRAVNVFMTGLPYLATEKHIAAHFSDVGPCTVQLIKDPVTSKSNGTGFATFTSAENALQASTHGKEHKIQGRWIKLRLCEPRESGAGNKTQGPGEKPEGCLSVVIKCDKSITEASLKRFFADCEVANVSRMMDRESGEFRGSAFMDFEDTAMVDKAVAKSGETIKGNPVLVRYKQPKKGEEKAPVKKEESSTTGKVAAHNRAPPVPKPSGKAKTFDSDSDAE